MPPIAIARIADIPDEVATQESYYTRKGVERIIRAAFAWAEAHGRTRVTMCDKSNAVPAHTIWQQQFKAVAAGADCVMVGSLLAGTRDFVDRALRGDHT